MKKQVFPWHANNQFQLLIDGPAFFPHMLKAIAQAQQTIELELYLLEPSACADQVLAALSAAAQRGVRVRCLFDHYGSRSLGHQRLTELARLCELRLYNPISWRRGLNNLYRDHRKLLLIDGQHGYVGGTGLTAQFWQPEQSSSAWHELMVLMQGPVLVDWCSLFEHQWQACALDKPWRTQNGLLGASLGHLPVHPQGARGFARLAYASANQHRDIVQGLNRALRAGQQRVWFATPYFLPTWGVRRALRKAAKRGLDVRLLTASQNTDNAPVRYAGQRYYASLLRAGVRVFEYQPQFLHLKMVLVDDWVSLGSCNFDHWNLRFNLDANLEAKDQALTQAVSKCFEQDFSLSYEVSLLNWKKRSLSLRFRQRFWGWINQLVAKVFKHVE